MPRSATVPGQLPLPGMASHCPHCGSHAVEPAPVASGDEEVSANEWRCRRCSRDWWQMAVSPKRP